MLVGALETDPRAAELPVDFVSRQADLRGAIEARLAAGYGPLVVGWSFYSPSFGEAARRLRALRAELDDPRVLHLAGGVHASAEPEQTLRAGFDLVAVGEGERTVVALAQALLAGEDPRVRGIWDLDEAGALRRRGKGEVVDLNDWPPFAVRHDKLGPIELTRGCIYACSFCQTPFLNRARFRHRSLADVRRWVTHLRRREFRDYRFLSPTSLSYGSQSTEPDLEALEALLAMVREVIGPQRRLFYGTFPSELRPEHVTPRALRLLKRYVDNDSLIIAAQSGSARVLEATHRGHGVEVIEQAVRCALAEGFRPDVDFLFGLPGEAPADVEDSLALAERLADLGARIHGHTFMPLPGTPLRDAAPGSLAERTRRRLDRLAARGALYGQWRRQEQVAVQLARRALPVVSGPELSGGPGPGTRPPPARPAAE